MRPIAPSTDSEHRARAQDPSQRPAREVRDEGLRREVTRVWAENDSVYGAQRVWEQLLREQARLTDGRRAREEAHPPPLPAGVSGDTGAPRLAMLAP